MKRKLFAIGALLASLGFFLGIQVKPAWASTTWYAIHVSDYAFPYYCLATDPNAAAGTPVFVWNCVDEQSAWFEWAGVPITSGPNAGLSLLVNKSDGLCAYNPGTYAGQITMQQCDGTWTQEAWNSLYDGHGWLQFFTPFLAGTSYRYLSNANDRGANGNPAVGWLNTDLPYQEWGQWVCPGPNC